MLCSFAVHFKCCVLCWLCILLVVRQLIFCFGKVGVLEANTIRKLTILPSSLYCAHKLQTQTQPSSLFAVFFCFRLKHTLNQNSFHVRWIVCLCGASYAFSFFSFFLSFSLSFGLCPARLLCLWDLALYWESEELTLKRYLFAAVHWIDRAAILAHVAVASFESLWHSPLQLVHCRPLSPVHFWTFTTIAMCMCRCIKRRLFSSSLVFFPIVFFFFLLKPYSFIIFLLLSIHGPRVVFAAVFHPCDRTLLWAPFRDRLVHAFWWVVTMFLAQVLLHKEKSSLSHSLTSYSEWMCVWIEFIQCSLFVSDNVAKEAPLKSNGHGQC